jgi:hypothetical protein
MSNIRRRNIGQIMRSTTLSIIQEWIDEAKSKDPEAEIDRAALKRKICLVIGATPKKAEDYLEVLGIQ